MTDDDFRVVAAIMFALMAGLFMGQRDERPKLFYFGVGYLFFSVFFLARYFVA